MLGDAIGHGVHAARIMSTVSAVARRVVVARPDPAGLLAELNAAIAGDLPDQIVTCVCCPFAAATSTYTAGVAGHPLPLWMRAAGEDLEEVGERNPALGMFSDTTFATCEVRLAPGEALVFYTDGVIEAMNASRELYGEARMRGALRHAGVASAQNLTASLLADVPAFCDGAPLEDDLALLILRQPPA